MGNMEKLQTPLELKVALLSYGLQIPPGIVKILEKKPDGWNWGRASGAGPAGGRYFELIDPPSLGQVLINIPLQSQQAINSPLLVGNVEGSDFLVITPTGKYCATLRLLPIPEFSTKPVGKKVAKNYALLHAKDCLAATVNQRCVHWTEGAACRYCGIELSLEAGTTEEVKTPQNLLEVLNLALAETPVTHVTLTIGTQPDESRGISQYIPIVKTLKENYPDIKIHAQFEPPLSDDYIYLLRDAGCDTVGIHVEITDDATRLEFCPGKGQLPWETYLQAWRVAVDAFGKNQVDSYLLLGLESFSGSVLDRIKEMCEIGVIPYPVPVREIPGTGFIPPRISIHELVAFHHKIAQIMKTTGVDPAVTLAGCVRCSACSAIGEAYKI